MTERVTSLRNEARENIEALHKNPYPGRGIILGLSDDGKTAIQVYFMTGRSEPTRNRVLIEKSGIIKTGVADKNKPSGDPKNTIYTAARKVKNSFVVTNGKQTNAIVSAIKNGIPFEEELRDHWSFEEDSNDTPRISGVITLGVKPKFALSLIKRGHDNKPSHSVWYLERDLKPGFGYCIHTYKTAGEPTPSFEGSPYVVSLKGGVLGIAETYWNLLQNENLISLVVKGIDLDTGEETYRIKNRYGLSGAKIKK